MRRIYKDENLAYLANAGHNVAMFASFGPDMAPRFSRVAGQAGHVFTTPEAGAQAIIELSGAVGVRTFRPEQPDGNPLFLDVAGADEAAAIVRDSAAEGYYTILSEGVPLSETRISGVACRGLVEFAPGTTPRCVDDPAIDTCALPYEAAMAMIFALYGVTPPLGDSVFQGKRIEFSVSSHRHGCLQQQCLVWQSTDTPGGHGAGPITAPIVWPNAMSRAIGDKTFGLLLLHSLGFTVPRTIAHTHHLFPFAFGQPTGSGGGVYTRCAPATKEPGLYPTMVGEQFPRGLLGRRWDVPEDAAPLTGVVVQEAVLASWSGRARFELDGQIMIEGVAGTGGDFMLGEAPPEELPELCLRDVERELRTLEKRLGRVGIEWVHDGTRAWIVQVNQDRRYRPPMAEDVASWSTFQVGPDGGIAEFRNFVQEVRENPVASGIVVVGNVSPLSHIGELAEAAEVPVRFERPLE